MSFDVDGLEPSFCPNTGTPVPGGLSFREAVFLLDTIAQAGRRIVGFDLCEVAPGEDGDEWDANVGSRLLYKLIGFMLKSQQAARGSQVGSTARRLQPARLGPLSAHAGRGSAAPESRAEGSTGCLAVGVDEVAPRPARGPGGPRCARTRAALQVRQSPEPG